MDIERRHLTNRTVSKRHISSQQWIWAQNGSSDKGRGHVHDQRVKGRDIQRDSLKDYYHYFKGNGL